MDTLERIKEYMEQRGWTEYRLAKESGLSPSTVSNMFLRQTAPSVPRRQRATHDGDWDNVGISRE